MDGMFPYSESERRKARKLKALAEGVAEQVSVPDPAIPGLASRPNLPTDFRVRPAPKPSRKPAVPAARRAGARSASTPGAPGVRVVPSSRSSVAPANATRPAPGRQPPRRAPVPGAQPASGGRRGAAGGVRVSPTTGLKANAERLLLESKELDLFGVGPTGHVCICPDCQHEIVKIVCLGIPVRACLECKGVWISYHVVRDFAREQEWFLQLGPAIQLEVDKRKRTT